MPNFRNPAHLLNLNQDPDLYRLLRACGAEEAYISGGASDLDKFQALAEIMPLCRGHRQAARVNRVLQEATGLSAPLCPHTAPAFWTAWVDQYWYGSPTNIPALPVECPHCKDPTPTLLRAEQITYLPNPLTVGGENLSAWTKAWESLLAESRNYPALTLPQSYSFQRPDPYHAGEVVRKRTRNVPTTPDEENLLLTQSLRVWGQWSLRVKPPSPLLLLGGNAEAVTLLLAYLQASRALASLTWIHTDPAAAEPISGLYDCVSTGLDLTDCPSPDQKNARVRAYSKIAPRGLATILAEKENP